MNTDWNELIHRYIAGQTTDEETRHLEASLKADDKLAGDACIFRADHA
jgi:anti-sigma factor RsiW